MPLKLKCAKRLSTYAFKSNLRRFMVAATESAAAGGDPAEVEAACQAARNLVTATAFPPEAPPPAHRSPRHRIMFHSRHEGSECLSGSDDVASDIYTGPSVTVAAALCAEFPGGGRLVVRSSANVEDLAAGAYTRPFFSST
jgi:hypothetical protein